jgi:tRNA 2-thiouridine synthesizing protein A
MLAADLEIDASGLACPLPLLKAKQGLNQLSSGQCLRLTATDPGSVRDFHAFAELSPHELVAFQEQQGAFIYLLRKA